MCIIQWWSQFSRSRIQYMADIRYWIEKILLEIVELKNSLEFLFIFCILLKRLFFFRILMRIFPPVTGSFPRPRLIDRCLKSPALSWTLNTGHRLLEQAGLWRKEPRKETFTRAGTPRILLAFHWLTPGSPGLSLVSYSPLAADPRLTLVHGAGCWRCWGMWSEIIEIRDRPQMRPDMTHYHHHSQSHKTVPLWAVYFMF